MSKLFFCRIRRTQHGKYSYNTNKIKIKCLTYFVLLTEFDEDQSQYDH